MRHVVILSALEIILLLIFYRRFAILRRRSWTVKGVFLAFVPVWNFAYLWLTATSQSSPYVAVREIFQTYYIWPFTFLAIAFGAAFIPITLVNLIGELSHWLTASWRYLLRGESRFRHDPTKRSFLKGASSFLLGGGFTVSVLGTSKSKTDPQVESLQLPLPSQCKSIRGLVLVQISDFHIGPFLGADELRKTIDRVLILRPDVILFTGDFMNFEHGFLNDLRNTLACLRAPLGIYAVLGNHDFYHGVDSLVPIVEQFPEIRLLRNQWVTPPGLPELAILGIDDPQTAPQIVHDYPQLPQWAANAPAGSRYRLLLSHRPDAFPIASRCGFQLTLSGHTHGGQVNIPLPEGASWNISRLAYPYDMGLYRQGGAYLYVNRGLGFVGAPVRINTPPEITKITLV